MGKSKCFCGKKAVGKARASTDGLTYRYRYVCREHMNAAVGVVLATLPIPMSVSDLNRPVKSREAKQAQVAVKDYVKRVLSKNSFRHILPPITKALVKEISVSKPNLGRMIEEPEKTGQSLSPLAYLKSSLEKQSAWEVLELLELDLCNFLRETVYVAVPKSGFEIVLKRTLCEIQRAKEKMAIARNRDPKTGR